MFVGRSRELAELVAVLDRATAGEAGVVLLGGDAGIGKSRLVGELAAIARERGDLVLVGQCAQLGDSFPYLPLADALREPALVDVLASRPVLRRLLPDSRTAEDGGAPGLTQQQLFGAVLGLLGELGEERPVLLVLEDLHWADRSTRDLLTFLGRVLERERICLVGTYRSDDLHRRHPLRPLIAELSRVPAVSTIELRPLPREALAGHLADRSAGYDAEDIDAILVRAEGNPFYAEELLDATSAGERLPTGLADLLLARVERVSEQAQQVLRVASVAGRRVDDDVLRSVSGLGASSDEALREIVSHRLLVADGADGYTFRHALLREAVYEDLLPGERTRLHAAFAAQVSDPAELAYHYLAGHDLAGALRASVAAGREAERVGAPAEAHRHFDEALSLWEAVPQAADLADISRGQLALRSAAAAADSGDYHRAAAHLRRIRDALAQPVPATGADVLLLAEINERLAYYLADSGELADGTAAACAAVELLPADPPTALLARAYATQARTMLHTDKHDDAPRFAAHALAAAKATDAADAETGALVTLGLHTEMYGPADALFVAARERARQVCDLTVELRAVFQLARTEFDRGDLTPALRNATEGVRMAAGAGLSWSHYGTDLRFLEYLIHYTAGDWVRAGELADGFAVRVGTTAQALVSAYALFVDVGRGSPVADERLSWLRPLWNGDPMVGYLAHGLAAEHALWKGDHETALDHVGEAMRLNEPWEPTILRIAAIGLQASPTPAHADELLAQARVAATTNKNGKARASIGPEGQAWFLRAEAEWHHLRGDDTPDMWRAVANAFDYGFPYEEARSRWRLAESLADHGARAEAAEEWRRATAIADRLGAAPLQNALTDLARRAHLQPAAQPTTPTLTARENEVMRLVAEGRSNREIAAVLFIAPKTASVHVSNILAKLGATNRTEAAALFHQDP